MIAIGSKSSLLKHVVSFRRYVYMILKDNTEELGLTLNFSHESFNYVIYVETNSMRCFGCKENGHLIRDCPRTVAQTDKVVELNAANTSVGGVQNEITVDAEVPGPTVDRAVEAEQNNEVIPTKLVTGGKKVLAVGKNPLEGDAIIDPMVESEDSHNVVDSGEQMLMDQSSGVSVLELDDFSFKAPQKRKSMEQHASKPTKKADVRAVSQTDTDSEGSECSFTGSLPGSGFSSQLYNCR